MKEAATLTLSSSCLLMVWQQPELCEAMERAEYGRLDALGDMSAVDRVLVLTRSLNLTTLLFSLLSVSFKKVGCSSVLFKKVWRSHST